MTNLPVGLSLRALEYVAPVRICLIIVSVAECLNGCQASPSPGQPVRRLYSPINQRMASASSVRNETDCPRSRLSTAFFSSHPRRWVKARNARFRR